MGDDLTREQTAAYLARLGYMGRGEPTLALLRDLHERHLLTVPFENLSIHLGEPISLDLPTLFEKVVERGRGGFCYELNGLFAALLRTLDYDVELLACRVHSGTGFGPPFDHLALSVGYPSADSSDERWLADVGFGRHTVYPLRLDTSADQHDPNGVFRLAGAPNGDLDVLQDEVPRYRVERRPRPLADFAPTCWWQQTWPDSHFRAGPVCSRLTETFGTITLAGRQLVSTEHGERSEIALGSDEEVLAAYATHFGVVLERVPG